MIANMYKGWCQIAFERELKYGINRVNVGGYSIMVIKQTGSIRAFDATCPHRGASLCDGKLVNGEYIVCAFHGCHIGIEQPGREGFEIKPYQLLVIGGLIFINISNENDNGFKAFVTELDKICFIIPGFQMKVNAKPEMVIENAFDQMHFRTVHNILNEPLFAPGNVPEGAYGIESVFELPSSKWHQSSLSQTLSVPYKAIAFSPYLVISSLAGDSPYYVITSAVPTQDGQASIRLSIGVVPDEQNSAPPLDLCQYLLEQSRKGLELDKKIWESMTYMSVQKFLKIETSVVQFQQFCKYQQ